MPTAFLKSIPQTKYRVIMYFNWSQLEVSNNFSDAIAFSNKNSDRQSTVSNEIEDQEMSELRLRLEQDGFSISRSIKDIADLSFHFERTNKRTCGVIVIRKSAISIDLLESIAKFLECKDDSQVVIVNGCNPIGEDLSEDVSDFWICLVREGGFFYTEDKEPRELFQRSRAKSHG